MDQKTKEALITEFFSSTGGSYNAVVNGFTLGIDHLWKKKMVHHLAASSDRPAPKRILDLACGTGLLTFAIAKRFPDSQVVAVDISAGYLEVAWRKAHKKKIHNVSFVLSPAEEFIPNDRFDAVTASYLPKYADLPRLIQNLSGMVNPGGMVLFHDFTYPKSRFLQWLFEGYFKLIPTIGGLLYPEWKSVLCQLPDVIRKTQWVTELTETLKKGPFDAICVESLTLEGSALVSARRK